jgi:hypothetical protein
MPDEGNIEEFENDGIEPSYANYEEMEQQDMEEGPDIDDIQSSANNEVEVEDLSEVPNQSSSVAAIGQSAQPSESSTSSSSTVNQNQQQIQSISSGSGNGNGNEAGPSTSGTSSSSLSPAAISQWRQSPNASTSRQQAQHLMLMNQTFDDASDDRIVPSTPTLYRSSRSDGFSEVVSSPHPAQVPHAAARFTFGESSSSSQNQNRPLVEGMDDTRVDLSDENNQAAGRSVPNIPQQQQLQQQSPCDNLINDSTSASTSSTSSSMSTVIQQDILEQREQVPGSSNQEESQVPEISVTDEGKEFHPFDFLMKL